MMFRGHRPIFGCIDHNSLPRTLRSPGRRRSERRGTLKGVPAMEFRNGKPERFALAFRGGFSLHLHGDKVERPCPAPDISGECWAPRLVRDRGCVTLRAVAAQIIAVAVEVHHRVGDFLRAVPCIEIEHLVLVAAVLAISPESEQDVGLLAAQTIFQEFGRASAIEDGALQEVAALGFDAVLLRLRDAGDGRDNRDRHRDQPRAVAPRAGTRSRAGGLLAARVRLRRWQWMCPSPQHAGGLPARGMTSLQVAPSFLGDFLEFVSNAAIEYRFARGHGAGEHQAQNALTRSASRTARSRPAFSAGSISAGESRSTLPGSAAIRRVLVPAASTYLSSCSISFGMLENREPLSVSATTKARLAPAMRSTWVLVEHMAPSMHSRSPIQVGPKTPGNDTLAQTACEIGVPLDCERTSRSPV